MRQHILPARARRSSSSRASSTAPVSLRGQRPGKRWVGGRVSAQPLGSPPWPSALVASAGHRSSTGAVTAAATTGPFPRLLRTLVPQAGALQRQPRLQLPRSGEVRAEKEGSRVSSPCGPPCTLREASQGAPPWSSLVGAEALQLCCPHLCGLPPAKGPWEERAAE